MIAASVYFPEELSFFLEVKEQFSIDDDFPEINVNSCPDADICGG